VPTAKTGPQNIKRQRAGVAPAQHLGRQVLIANPKDRWLTLDQVPIRLGVMPHGRRTSRSWPRILLWGRIRPGLRRRRLAA
jgi:hypothetical protein